MSKAIGHAILNTVWQMGNVFFSSLANFVTIFALTRFFSQENFGAYVSAQAQVAIWLLCVDLGLFNGMISSLTTARAQDNPALATAIVRSSFALRLAGAALGFLVVVALAYWQATTAEEGIFRSDIFWRATAFSPALFGYACQQNLNSYLTYRGQQSLTVAAQLIGTLVSSLVAVGLVASGAAVPAVLLAVSSSGFVAAAIMYGKIRGEKRSVASPTRLDGSIWRQLLLTSWPYALLFATTTIWQRLDQVRAADAFGLVLGAEYGLAARLVGIPLLLLAAVSVALFPDFQRTGLDAPEKLRLYISTMLKLLLRFGGLATVVLLAGVSCVIAVLFPKYEAALYLLPWFVPGLWAFCLFNVANNGLLGLRGTTSAVYAHLSGLVIYLAALYFFPRWLGGLHGIVLAYDLFCFCLFVFTYLALRRRPGWQSLALFSRLTREESAVVAQLREKILGRFR